MFQLNNPPSVLPEYEVENLNDTLRIDDDQISDVSNYDIDQEERKSQSDGSPEYEESKMALGYKDAERSPESSITQEKIVPQLGLTIQAEVAQNQTKNYQPLEGLDRMSLPGTRDDPYEDFLLSNGQQCQDIDQVEKMSVCSSEPANLKNLKIASQGKHFLMQKSSSSFRYEGFDIDDDGQPEFKTQAPRLDNGLNQDQDINSNHVVKFCDQKSQGKQLSNLNSRKPSQQSDPTPSKRGQGEKADNPSIKKDTSYSYEKFNESNEHKGDIAGGSQFDQFDYSQISTVNKGPRRPLSPYIFFSQEKRKELKKEHPEWNSQQIMKTVSVLWQRMSSDQKRDFQEQSKKDRERYETQRHDFVVNKDESVEDRHSVLETVKNRSKILKQQQIEKRKYSEDHIYYPEHLEQKKKRSRKESQLLEEELQKEGVQVDVQNKRLRKASVDVKPQQSQQHLDMRHTAMTQAQAQRKSTHDLPDRSMIHQIQQQAVLNPEPVIEKEPVQAIINRQLENFEKAINMPNPPDLKRKGLISQKDVRREPKAPSSDNMRIQSITNQSPSDSIVIQPTQRILPSPMMSSTSLQNFYNPSDFTQANQQQNFIRPIPSPQPVQQLGGQRIFFQNQIQPQFVTQPQIYQPQHQLVHQISLHQPQQQWTTQNQQLGQQLPVSYVTAQVSQDQLVGNNQQFTYFLPQQQVNIARPIDQGMPQQFIDQNMNPFQAIYPQGNPQNPPHGPVQKTPSSHELASMFQQQQNGFQNFGYQINQGANQNFYDEQIKQQQQQYVAQQNQLPQLNLQHHQLSQHSTIPSFNSQYQSFPQLIGLSSYQEQKSIQKDGLGISGGIMSTPNEDEVNGGQYPHQHIQRLSSTNIATQSNPISPLSFDVVPNFGNFQYGALPQSLNLPQPPSNNSSGFNVYQMNSQPMVEQAWDNQLATPKYEGYRQINQRQGEDDPVAAIDEEGLLPFKRIQQ